MGMRPWCNSALWLKPCTIIIIIIIIIIISVNAVKKV